MRTMGDGGGNSNDVIVIGSAGLLGKTLAAQIQSRFVAVGLNRNDLDITDPARTSDVICSLRPKIVILSAANSNVDDCEQWPEGARAVNVSGVENVARGCLKTGAVLVSLSTDMVFDGNSQRPYREDDPTGPVNVYGRTKLEGERIVQGLLSKSVIVRTTWLFGESSKGFVPHVVRSIREHKPMGVIADKTSSPTSTLDLSRALVELCRLILEGGYDFSRFGVLHIVNKGASTWFDIARFIFDYYHVRDLELSAVKLNDFPFKARRPRYSALDGSLFTKIFGRSMRSWQEALEEYLKCQPKI